MTAAISALFRHPIKGFTPEKVELAELCEGKAFPGDRLFALEDGPCGFDPANPGFIPKQRFAVLAKIAAVAKARTRFDDVTGFLHAEAEGQQPYLGPGYGYGPQPPRRRKRHLVRNTLAAVGGLVVAMIVIGALASHGSGVTTTPSGNSATANDTASPATAHKAAPARVGSYFDVQDSNGDNYRVTLLKVIDPAQGADEFSTPENGKRFVGIVFKIKALNAPAKRQSGRKVASVDELVEVLHTEAKVI